MPHYHQNGYMRLVSRQDVSEILSYSMTFRSVLLGFASGSCDSIISLSGTRLLLNGSMSGAVASEISE